MKTVLTGLLGLAFLVPVSAAQAGLWDAAKDMILDEAEEETTDVLATAVGLTVVCAVSGNELEPGESCLESSLGAAVAESFAKFLSEDDLESQEESVSKTILTGEEQSWENAETGASGGSKVVKEKTKNKKTKVVVLKDKVETVPELDLIGENYRANTSINVRGGPGTDYKVVGGLPAGSVVNVVGQVKNEDWYMISQGGIGSGFVAMSLLSWDPEADATVTEQPEGEIAEVETDAERTCKTIEQVVTLDDGTEEVEKIKACQGPNGWEIV